MKTKQKMLLHLVIGGVLFALFGLFTVLVKTVGVAPASPSLAPVGFSTINGAVFDFLGTSELAYNVSEVLGLCILMIPIGFALFALYEWIKRKNLFLVDRDLFVLFGAYAFTVLLYCFFEIVVINYRPILMEGALEASYPSSHTLLAVVILGTGIEQFRRRISKMPLKMILLTAIELLLILTVAFRLLAGVHWATDIFASLLLGSAIVCIYRGFVLWLLPKKE